MKQTKLRIIETLEYLYGNKTAFQTWGEIEAIIARYQRNYPHTPHQEADTTLSEDDVILITYGDQFAAPGRTPLETLKEFYCKYLADFISTVHILPFFPYSSDDGFSVIDYRQVDPDLGTWEDIRALGRHCKLMFDAVINHISRQSAWFQGYLRGEPAYQDYFITVDPSSDLSAVVRPRALPLLTAVETPQGPRHVWTTFSDDQIDLNYANPQVLLEMIEILLFYIERGARIIRLDAVAFLWKEIGTRCIHLPQTHKLIRLIRAVLDLVAPGVILISETNVPHEENISYFGAPLPEEESSGPRAHRGDEAQMVYQFPLAPLILHTFLTGEARKLSAWAASLDVPYHSATFFNFIASHDGIGVRPAEGLLAPEEVQGLVDRTIAHGGLVSYRTNPDGTQSVYELNIALYDALNDPADPDDALDAGRFLASQAIMLSLAGVPGIYVHSLFGSRNCQECVRESGRARSINRQKFDLSAIAAALEKPDSIAARVYRGYTRLLAVRGQHPAFHPHGEQLVLRGHEHIFAVLRTAPDESERILCLVNVSAQPQSYSMEPPLCDIAPENEGRDVLTGEECLIDEEILLPPYRVCWIQLR